MARGGRGARRHPHKRSPEHPACPLSASLGQLALTAPQQLAAPGSIELENPGTTLPTASHHSHWAQSRHVAELDEHQERGRVLPPFVTSRSRPH